MMPLMGWQLQFVLATFSEIKVLISFFDFTDNTNTNFIIFL